MGQQALHDGWTVRIADGSAADQVPAELTGTLTGRPGSTGPTGLTGTPGAGVPATVPGCVHTDLEAAGLIPDPYLDRNEETLRWIGRTDWSWSTTFDWAPGDGAGAERVDLVAEGLDTVATVTLNGREIGATQNMHRSYRWPVRDALVPGRNELVVRIDSPDRYAAAMRDRLGDLPGPNSATPEPFNFIRKMACNFGWDWGPVLTTSGIWKPIRLHTWGIARLASVRPQVRLDGSTGRIRVDVELERAGAGDRARALAIVVRLDDRGEEHLARVVLAPGRDRASVELDVPDVDPWWPHSLLAQRERPRLYDLEVTLAEPDAGADTLDSWSRRVGFRDVRLDTSADEFGTRFTFVVNGVELFARGANWIPDDCFVSRVGAERYRARLEQTKAANIDLLRVWGGGIYEKDEFYEACDELGILVWQDFLFACAAYPEEEPFGTEVEAEARENVERLMPHPSLVLWNGNNENIWGFQDWGWAEKLGNRTWGKGFYAELLPRVVAEVDPTRAYWPGSPFAGTFDLPVNAEDFGCCHVWDVWNLRDYGAYRQYVPRFVSEFGWQGPPTWATLTRAVHDEPLAPDSPGVLAHQKASEGNLKLARGLAPHFDEPASVADWHWATQLNQARALRVGIEHFRSHRGRCMGTVVWQINDCWPVTSWAAVDGDGRRKPLWYALRDAYADQLLTIQPRGSGGLHVVAVNDSATLLRGPLVVERRGFDGTVLARWSEQVEVAPRSVAEFAIPSVVGTPDNNRAEFLLAGLDGVRGSWYFAPDRELDYPSPAMDLAVRPGREPDSAEVTVTARSFVRDLALFADRLEPDAWTDGMLMTLLPGESTTFTVRRAGRDISADEVSGPPVLRCANDLVVRGATA